MNISNDYIQVVSDMPGIVGRPAMMEGFKAWGNLIDTVHHLLTPVYVTDNGWVNSFISCSTCFHNADKSKIYMKHILVCLKHIHINDEGKIDRYFSFWDMEEFLGAMLSTAQK
jgi:DNA mismatch repair protein MutH